MPDVLEMARVRLEGAGICFNVNDEEMCVKSCGHLQLTNGTLLQE